MKGLELCQRFFFEVGLPAIERDLPESIPHLAAGAAGGSHCYGNDDETSRDHGWGPGFVVWLNEFTYQALAEPLREVLDQLPRQFLGIGWQLEPQHTCRVYEIGKYTRHLVGNEMAPQEDAGWLHIPEYALFEITHRPVFLDATREVTRHFASFQRYPEDVWKKRLSACLAWLWRWGVEYLPRAERRGDWITAAMYWCRFTEYTMKVGFLLNRSYAPYHKWLHREFLKLPNLAQEVAPLLSRGFGQERERATTAAQIISAYSDAVSSLGFRPIGRAEGQPHIDHADQLLYRYATGIQDTIVNPAIKDLNLYVEVCPPTSRPTWGWFTFERRADF